MAKRGRKEKYESHVQPYLDRIPVWRRQGMTEEQIATKLGVHIDSLNTYRRQYTELFDVLKTGTAELIEELEETLYIRAKGKEYEEVKVIIDKDEETGRDRKRIEKTKKMLHSDACLIFALKNLHANKWRDKQVIEHEEARILLNDEVERYLAEIRLKQEQKNDTIIDENDEQEA